ncbi:unnamed protein product [Echinostoma caproni]|uniref:Uncharacterized protein n=1 Tax=Echinostoma caproni TaxID=27848 RepID=A0A183A6H9_9TREM|nr:unnamed protein product [Echinostoma caproni]
MEDLKYRNIFMAAIFSVTERENTTASTVNFRQTDRGQPKAARLRWIEESINGSDTGVGVGVGDVGGGCGVGNGVGVGNEGGFVVGGGEIETYNDN